MSKNLQHKIIKIRGRSGQNRRGRGRVKIRYLVVAGALMGAVGIPRVVEADAASCPDVRVVFARGSGGERWRTDDYQAFKEGIEGKLATTSLKYEFIDLDYPAVGVGIDHLETTVGAFFGSGNAYEFGASVNTGVRNLVALVNGASCPGTKYVIGGYSQGAMVVSKALGGLRADRVVYAATFGDPKLYLPEGKGMMPAACKGENLSDYRMYVPDCQAYKGLLGAYIPYEPEALVGKVGTWCNRGDIFCSSHLNISDHLAYVSESLYEDASRVIFDKVCRTFGVENQVSSPHDTAILIDSTGSMAGMIDSYKAEAMRLARETLAADGRVALYDYRDYQEGYEARQRCSFETCTLETFQAGLDEIRANGGGDTNESLLASSLHMMQELSWKRGATKSVVVLTDAGYHNPDYDVGGTTQLDVVALSKRIDPVNFYVITNAEYGAEYEELAAATGGRVVTELDELSLLTDYIMERYDSLPKVEEDATAVELPTVTVDGVSYNEDGATVEFVVNGGDRVMVVLDDYVLGVVEASDGVGTATVEGLDAEAENMLMLVPLGDDVRGEVVEVRLGGGSNGGLGGIDGIGGVGGEAITDGDSVVGDILIPKAPNTGKR